jgi:DNA-binding response OmpR family regulator
MTENNLSKTILIVDDNPVITRLIESRLTEKGFSTISTNEAAEGLQLAMSRNIALIVLDVMMPIVNGYNFCRLLKSEKDKKEIPIIFLTSRDKEEDKLFGKEMGAEAYLTKPVDIELLLETVNRLIQKGQVR